MAEKFLITVVGNSLECWRVKGEKLVRAEVPPGDYFLERVDSPIPVSKRIQNHKYGDWYIIVVNSNDGLVGMPIDEWRNNENVVFHG